MNQIFVETLGVVPVPRKELEELYGAFYFKQACQYLGIEEWEKYNAVLDLAEEYANQSITEENKDG